MATQSKSFTINDVKNLVNNLSATLFFLRNLFDLLGTTILILRSCLLLLSNPRMNSPGNTLKQLSRKIIVPIKKGETNERKIYIYAKDSLSKMTQDVATDNRQYYSHKLNSNKGFVDSKEP